MTYSETLMMHFWNPKNNLVMKNPDGVGVAGIPGNGPFLVLYLRLLGEVVVEASFQTHGCAPSIAVGSWLTTKLPGTPIAEDPKVMFGEDPIDKAMGGLPAHKRHCAILGAEAVRRAFADARETDEWVVAFSVATAP